MVGCVLLHQVTEFYPLTSAICEPDTDSGRWDSTLENFLRLVTGEFKLVAAPCGAYVPVCSHISVAVLNLVAGDSSLRDGRLDMNMRQSGAWGVI